MSDYGHKKTSGVHLLFDCGIYIVAAIREDDYDESGETL
jgi:hypothetical protein